MPRFALIRFTSPTDAKDAHRGVWADVREIEAQGLGNAAVALRNDFPANPKGTLLTLPAAHLTYLGELRPNETTYTRCWIKTA